MGLAKPILAGLEKCLRAHAGLELPAWVVESRATLRMNALELDPKAYFELVTSAAGAAELGCLVEAVRVGETRFFRHRPQVDALVDVVIPTWKERGTKNPRVWSAGCATGEEPYTLALVLAGALPRPAFAPTILATDVSREAISVAKRALYPRAALESVPEPWRGGLAEEGASIRVRPEIASLVTFQEKNLASADQPRGFDLVWCRNVLIYFEEEARRRTIDKLANALVDGGFLFVGYSETLRDVPSLEPVSWGDQVLFRKTGAPTRPRAPVAPETRASLPTPRRQVAKVDKPHAPPPSSRRTHRSTSPRAKTPTGAAVLRITSGTAAALSSEISAALGVKELTALTIDLDGADFLADDAAPVLRRACAVAEAAGIDVVLHATRSGPKRWLRRNGLVGGDS